VSIVAELVEFYQKSLEEVEELFRDSKSIDEIALTIDKWADRQPSFLIKFWKERPDEARGWVNLGREALHLTPLDFANTINGVTEDKRPLKRTPRKKNATSN
jgi:hypothetical protein